MAAFVGREHELGVLAKLIGSAGPRAALISGVPGAGKSRLMAEALALAPRVRSFSVAGYESERQVPLAAAAGLLRSLVSIGPQGEPLDRLLFSFDSGDSGPVSMPTGPGAGTLEPLRVFEAARRCLATVQPAVLVIDDLQWLDDLSFSLCHYLLRAASESSQRLVVLSATRPAGRDDDLYDTVPVQLVERIALGPLSRDEGSQLARNLDPGLAPEKADIVWQQAGGVPYWLEALVLHDRQAEGIDQLITRRMRGISQEVRALLGALALLDRSASIGRLAQLLDQSTDSVEAGLGVLVDRGLVSRSDGEARLAHDLLRNRAVAELPAEFRRRLRKRIAALLEGDACDDIGLLSAALEHRRAAGLPHLELAGRIAGSAQRRLMGADGLGALASLADEADPLEPATVRLQSDLAKLASELGEHEQALSRWSLVGERVDDVGARAAAMFEESRVADALGRVEEARELLSSSRDLAAEDELLALEQLTHEGAICLWLEGRAAEGRALARQVSVRARKLAKRASREGIRSGRVRRVYLEALRLEYEAAIQDGDPEAVLRAAEERERVARSVDLEEMLAASLAVGVALRQQGRVSQAIGRFRRIRDEAERVVLPLISVDAGFWLGRTLAVLGDLVQAEPVLVETHSLARRVGDVPRARYRVGRVVAEVWFERGRLADATTVLEREVVEASSDHQRILLHGDRAAWEARLHGSAALTTVREQLGRAEAFAADAGCPRCFGELMRISAEALCRVGARDEARVAWQRRSVLTPERDELELLLARHVEALTLDDPQQMVTALERVRDEADASPYRLPALWIWLDLGTAMAASGSGEAAGVLQRAAASARGSGANTVAEIADRSLRELGVRTWRRHASGAPLTQREQEVARLVAGGATNREIAAALFLSPKTVEQHLVNLFRKLDVRNRTELALKLAEADSKLNSKIAGNP
ncbi:hypothetical protein BH24CHL6_BH24CHL6_14120 [soil metagenome]